ncbi:MAG: hypothetical protein ABJB97_10750 [Acidobacteriota bacterium]
MNIRRANWPIWAGFLLSLIAFLTYPFVFVRFPVTRDFPWANFALFALAGVLLLIGLKRAFAPAAAPEADSKRAGVARRHRTRSRVGGVITTALSVAIFAFFIFSFLVLAKRLPASHGAPQVGQKAPDFTLPDTNGKPVSLSELLASTNGKPNKGALLIFYRGYW